MRLKLQDDIGIPSAENTPLSAVFQYTQLENGVLVKGK